MWFTIIGIIAVILGILYWFFPSAVNKLNEIGKKMVLTPEKFLERRKITGLLYFIAGIILLSVCCIK